MGAEEMNSDKSKMDGTLAPDFDATTTSGDTVKASDYWKSSPVVLVFLRHLGCTFCRTQVIELSRTYAKFRDLGGEVVCVAMGSYQAGKAFQIMFDVPFPILMLGEDNTRPYQQYNLGKGSLGQLFGLASLMNGFKAMAKLKSRTLGKIEGDGMQMPGTFIVDRNGVIQFAYLSENASDNPPTNLLLGALSKITGGIPINVNLSEPSIGSK